MAKRIAMTWIGLAFLTVATGLAQDQASDEALEKAKQLTVMINAAIDGDARPGAGIIFALANDQIYIATANHLVRRGLSKASDVQVEFKWLPGQPLPAQLLTYYDDRALDLAVLVVDSAKARVRQADLPLDRLGDPTALTRGSPVSAIGYPDGTAYDVSAAQISQMEAVLLKYRVPGLVPGGYSGGPLVDRNGMIVGMIRQDQPPDGEATRIDLVVSQLKAWNYQVSLLDRRKGTVDPAKQPVGSTGDSFRNTLLRYIADAPSGFRELGAKQIGNWNPTVNIPDAISCRGGGSAREPFIECVMYRSNSESEAVDQFEDLIDIVQAALPAWKGDRLNLFRAYFADGQSGRESVANVDLGVSHVGANYDVTLSVRHLDRESAVSPPPANSPLNAVAPLLSSFSNKDSFQEVLQSYIAAAPSGFAALGAKAGEWVPSVSLPGSIDCRGTTRVPGIVGAILGTYITCTVFHSEDRTAADLQFTEIGAKVQSALPGQEWERHVDTDPAGGSLQLRYKNGPTTVTVVRTVYVNGYDVYVEVTTPR